jgi:uridine kinase
MNAKTEQSYGPVREGKPRTTVQARFPDGRVFDAPLGTPVEAYVKTALADSRIPVIAGLVDGELHELTYVPGSDVRLEPVFLSDSDGVRIYRRSLAFLLVTAVRELFPDSAVFVDHTMPFGGFFCTVEGRGPFTKEELSGIENRMRQIVEEDAPITRDPALLEDALELFRGRGEFEKLRLQERRHRSHVTLYDLHGFRDYFHGFMVPSTGYLQHFALHSWPPGFVLQYPRRSRPTELLPVTDYPNLTAVFREYGDWLRVLGVESVSALNEANETSRLHEVILVSEAFHEQRIAYIADQIARRREEIRLVLVAGPSASGKTTFSKRLSVQLLAHGIRPYPLGLDNYFVDREKTPRDPDGDYDFEALEALDVRLLNSHLPQLVEGKSVQLPRFNFLTGKREKGDRVRLGPDHILIVEGIHGLNPQLVPSMPRETTYRVYASALTQLNIDRHNRVPTTDTRLIRRLVRDAVYRGYSAEDTLNRWEGVRRGEKKYIFPYQEHADTMFNSALVYELAVLKPLAVPLLLQVKHSSPRRVEAKRLLTLLQWFEPCGQDLMPDNSILREFVGGSILRDYSP